MFIHFVIRILFFFVWFDRTGTGKTRVLDALKSQSIDLEGLADHRGSAFGYLPENPFQSSQIDFENSVSIAMLKALGSPAEEGVNRRRILVEDESSRIGKLIVPSNLKKRMENSDGIVVVKESIESRVDVILEDYIFDLRKRFVAVNGGDQVVGSQLHREFCLGALGRCQKRLGGVLYERLRETMESAFQEEQISGDLTLHQVWIASLLVDYYDKFYDYQLGQRESKVLFSGKRDAVIEWAMTMNQPSAD